MCASNGVIDERRAREIVDQLIESDHSRAPAILKQFLRRLRLEAAKSSAFIESAVPLAPEVGSAVEGGLRRRYGASLRTTFKVDPTLIGGLRVTVGSDVYDGSVKSGLATLESRF
jgi:F-type H+-transporting ATPase subunit delta